MAALTKVKQFFTGGNEEVPAAGDNQNNQLVASGNPGYMETRRRGNGLTVITTSAITPLAAVPTTTARLEIYNNGNRLLVVSDLHIFQLLSTAVVQSAYAVWAMTTTAKAVPTLTALSLFSMAGKPLITPTATSEVVTGVGTTVVANGWQPYGRDGGAFGLAAATPGHSGNVSIDGKLIAPPGTSVCFQIVGPIATASSFQMGVTFDMVNATIEA